MDNFEEKACLCALSRIFGFEPKTGLALIERMGCASAVFALDKDGLDELLGPYCKQRFQIRQSAVFEAAGELEALAKRILSNNDIMYCPHGRPVAFELKRSELERQFGRAK